MCSIFPILSQAVYMHEAQQDAAEGDSFSFSGFIILAILIGIIWFVSRCINDYLGNKKKEVLKKRDEERRERIHKEVENFFDSINCKKCIKIGDYKAVDLGLPSKILWATENIGASYYAELGELFAWGNNNKIDRQPIYDIFQTPLQISDIEKNIKIRLNNGSYSGIKEYDAATNARGEKWRTPTSSEVQELLDNCIWQYVTSGTVKGWKIIGSNANFIFLPIRTEFLMDNKTPYLTSNPDPDDTKVSLCEIGKYKNGLFLMFNRIGWEDNYTHELESRGRIRGGYVRAVTKNEY
jgi:hypothetical protein